MHATCGGIVLHIWRILLRSIPPSWIYFVGYFHMWHNQLPYVIIVDLSHRVGYMRALFYFLPSIFYCISWRDQWIYEKKSYFIVKGDGSELYLKSISLFHFLWLIIREIPWSLVEYLLDAFGRSMKYFVDEDVFQIFVLFLLLLGLS